MTRGGALTGRTQARRRPTARNRVWAAPGKSSHTNGARSLFPLLSLRPLFLLSVHARSLPLIFAPFIGGGGRRAATAAAASLFTYYSCIIDNRERVRERDRDSRIIYIYIYRYEDLRFHRRLLDMTVSLARSLTLPDYFFFSRPFGLYRRIYRKKRLGGWFARIFSGDDGKYGFFVQRLSFALFSPARSSTKERFSSTFFLLTILSFSLSLCAPFPF